MKYVQTHKEEIPVHEKNLLMTLDITVVFSFKKKIFFMITLKEVNYIACSLQTDGCDHSIVVSIFKHLRYSLKCYMCDKSI